MVGGTETQQGKPAINAGQVQVQTPQPGSQTTSAGQTGTSTTPKTFTESEVQELVIKATSDSKTVAGRLQTELDLVKPELDQVKQNLAKLQEERQRAEAEREAAEEESLRDDTDGLAQFRKRQALKVKEKELAGREQALTAKEASLAEVVEQHRILNRTMVAAEIAVEKGVSVDALLKLAKDDSREAMLAVAALLPSTSPGGDQFKPDSGLSSGGGLDLNAMSPRELIAYGLKQKEKARKKGVR